MTGTPRLTRAGAILAVALAATGCEYFRDTAEQKLAAVRWRECVAPLRDVKLDRVDTDGRIHFTYVALHERDRALECLEAAGHSGSPLPAPVSEAVAGR
ncbi:MAG TPA: hypothetical protein VJX92_08380 [Methylomirabilota bacterium]|nr:hypothetical protein [Methylomirabilota bacterium]